MGEHYGLSHHQFLMNQKIQKRILFKLPNNEFSRVTCIYFTQKDKQVEDKHASSQVELD